MSEIARVLLLKLCYKNGRKAEKIFISNFCPSVNGIIILHCNIYFCGTTEGAFFVAGRYITCVNMSWHSGQRN